MNGQIHFSCFLASKDDNDKKAFALVVSNSHSWKLFQNILLVLSNFHRVEEQARTETREEQSHFSTILKIPSNLPKNSFYLVKNLFFK